MTSSQAGTGRRGCALAGGRAETAALRTSSSDHSGSRSTTVFPDVQWEAPVAAAGAVRTESAGRELDIDRRHRPAWLECQVEAEHNAILKVAVGGEQDHRRDSLFAESLPQPRRTSRR